MSDVPGIEPIQNHRHTKHMYGANTAHVGGSNSNDSNVTNEQQQHIPLQKFSAQPR